MRRGVVLALSVLAVCVWFPSEDAASADPKPVACGLSCLTVKSKDEGQCTLFNGDEKRECMERVSLKYRMCTQTCAAPQVKNGPASPPALTRTNIYQD